MEFLLHHPFDLPHHRRRSSSIGEGTVSLSSSTRCSRQGMFPHCRTQPATRAPAGWGSLYAALTARAGRTRPASARCCRATAPRRPTDLCSRCSVWARCDAETSPGRGYYYHPSRHSAGQPIVAGWAYQWVSQLGFARDSLDRTAGCSAGLSGRGDQHGSRDDDPQAGAPVTGGRAGTALRFRCRLRPVAAGAGSRRYSCGASGPPSSGPVLLWRPAALSSSPKAADRLGMARSSRSATLPRGLLRTWRIRRRTSSMGWFGYGPGADCMPSPKPMQGPAVMPHALSCPARWSGSRSAACPATPAASGALALVVRPRHAGLGPPLACLRPPFRPGTHLPLPQRDAELDPAALPSPGPSRPLVLAGPRGLHPPTARPSPGRRSPVALGATAPLGAVDSLPRPPGGFVPLRGPGHARNPAKTLRPLADDPKGAFRPRPPLSGHQTGRINQPSGTDSPASSRCAPSIGYLGMVKRQA